MAAIISFIAGAAIAAFWFASRRAGAQAEIANARARADLLDQQCREHVHDLDRAREQFTVADKARELAERHAAVSAEQQKQIDEKKRLLDEAEKRLIDVFGAVGAKALQANNQQFLHLAEQKLAPFKELLDKQSKAVSEIEQKREKAYGSIEQQIKTIADSHQRLGSETAKLVKALRRPEQRGRWGEMQLRNAVELAGMTEHCDFNEQVTLWTGDGMQRPDLVVKLPRRGVIPIDAKVAIDAYLDGLESEQPESQAECLRRHADQVERHVKILAHKRYWDGFSAAHAPQLVVMFMPLESALIAALDIKPDLHNQAMQQHVLIATPMLLVALLRAVAYGWQQDALAKNADEIAATGKELYERLAKFVEGFEKVGGNLEAASKAYNAAIGTLEARLLPSARKLKALQATTEEEIQTPALIEVEVRPIVVAELKAPATPQFQEFA